MKRFERSCRYYSNQAGSRKQLSLTLLGRMPSRRLSAIMSARFRCCLDCSSGPGRLEKLAASNLKPLPAREATDVILEVFSAVKPIPVPSRPACSSDSLRSTHEKSTLLLWDHPGADCPWRIHTLAS